jgi:hypothetical protein
LFGARAGGYAAPMRAAVSTIAIALACLTAFSSADPAAAGHAGKNCGIVSVGSGDHRVRALKLKCKVARKSSVRYLRSERPRRGFDCAPTQGGNFYCQKGPKAYWATRLSSGR